jgi:hypothetical protein
VFAFAHFAISALRNASFGPSFARLSEMKKWQPRRREIIPRTEKVSLRNLQPRYSGAFLFWRTSCVQPVINASPSQGRSWLDATGAPLGVQQKLLRHAHIDTTMQYRNALKGDEAILSNAPSDLGKWSPDAAVQYRSSKQMIAGKTV